MTTPRKAEIINRAIELWRQDRIKANDPSFDITPTEQELKEGGYLSQAQSELMRDNHKSAIESEYVDFPESFSVDLKELFESNALILGSRHTGKSDLAMLIVEKTNNAVVVVFDPSQDWIKRSNIPSFMKVEPHTNLEVPNENIIYDLSLLSPNQQQRTVEKFSKQLFESQAKTLNRKQYLVVFEEAHTYFYQGCMRAKRFQNTVKLLSVGRNVNIACLLISQFASMLDKFAIKHSTSQAWFGYTREPNDLRYLQLILGDTAKELTKLHDGEFVYLNRHGIFKIQIEPYENSTTTKTQISNPQLIEPISLKKDTTSDYEAITSLITCVLWFIALLVTVNGGL